MEGYTTFKKSPCHLGDYMVPGTYHLLKKKEPETAIELFGGVADPLPDIF